MSDRVPARGEAGSMVCLWLSEDRSTAVAAYDDESIANALDGRYGDRGQFYAVRQASPGDVGVLLYGGRTYADVDTGNTSYDFWEDACAAIRAYVGEDDAETETPDDD